MPDTVGAPHRRAGDPLIDPVIEYADHHQPGGLGRPSSAGASARGDAPTSGRVHRLVRASLMIEVSVF